MSKFLISFLLLLSFFSFRAQGAVFQRGGAELLNAKAYSVQVDASVFSMTGHFDNDGVLIPKLDNSSYQMIDTDFKISYGLSPNLELALMAKARNVNSSDGTTTAANTGPESVGFEAKYGFPQINQLLYAIGLRYRRTLYTNTLYTNAQIPPMNEVILGDDGSEYGVDFYATYLANPWKLDFKIGYNSPPNDLSSEVLYKLEALYKFTRLSLLVGIEGIYSLKRDQYTETPSLKPLLNTGPSRPSFIFNSINREKNMPYIGANYAFDKFLLGIKAQSIISGRSTDKGNIILASLCWNSAGVTSESVKIDSFKEYFVEGSVLKVSARGNFIKIDQGLSTDVEKGAKFDIYQTDYFGGNVLVGSGVVFEIGSDWAVIKLTKKYKEIEIKPGFAARGY